MNGVFSGVKNYKNEYIWSINLKYIAFSFPLPTSYLFAGFSKISPLTYAEKFNAAKIWQS